MDNNFKIIKNSLEAISTELDSMIADLVVKVLDKTSQLNEEVVRIDFEIDK